MVTVVIPVQDVLLPPVREHTLPPLKSTPAITLSSSQLSPYNCNNHRHHNYSHFVIIVRIVIVILIVIINIILCNVCAVDTPSALKRWPKCINWLLLYSPSILLTINSIVLLINSINIISITFVMSVIPSSLPGVLVLHCQY